MSSRQTGLWFHLHPPLVSQAALRPTATLGLGLLTAVLFGLLVLSGALLALYYLPSGDRAYQSLLDIVYLVPLGGFLRALHRWAAHLMVLTAVLHLGRVLACAAYRGRWRNWLLGLGLGLATLLFAFTGYLLPWDGRAYWAVRVCAGMLDNLPLAGDLLRKLLLGGEQVGEQTLVRFYSLHVFWLPVVFILLLLWHLWRLRRDGGLAVAAGSAEPRLPSRPHLLVREATLCLVACAAVTTAAMLWPAGMGQIIDPVRPADPEKAPWYFLGLQEMVSHSSWWGVVAVPGLVSVLLLALPWLDPGGPDTGVWWGGRRQRRVVMGALVLGVTVLGVSLAFEWQGKRPCGVHPTAVMTVLAGVAGLIGWRLSGSRRGGLLVFFTIMALALAGFTLVGWWRGPGWLLPGQIGN